MCRAECQTDSSDCCQGTTEQVETTNQLVELEVFTRGPDVKVDAAAEQHHRPAEHVYIQRAEVPRVLPDIFERGNGESDEPPSQRAGEECCEQEYARGRQPPGELAICRAICGCHRLLTFEPSALLWWDTKLAVGASLKRGLGPSTPAR